MLKIHVVPVDLFFFSTIYWLHPQPLLDVKSLSIGALNKLNTKCSQALCEYIQQERVFQNTTKIDNEHWLYTTDI